MSNLIEVPSYSPYDCGTITQSHLINADQD